MPHSVEDGISLAWIRVDLETLGMLRRGMITILKNKGREAMEILSPVSGSQSCSPNV
jgi:hypothetical protein